MNSTNFKIAFRSLSKRKAHSIINILGLAIGLASCAFILLFAQDEFSYDKSFKDSDRIYRMVLDRKYSYGNSIERYIPHSFAQSVVEDYPEVERAATYTGPFRDMKISYKIKGGEELKFYENVIAADSNFLKIFNLPMVAGDPQSALTEPRSIVLTKSSAKKHFGDENPIGRVIRMSSDDFKVTGVCEDLPDNTHLAFDFLISIHTIGRFNHPNYTRQDVGCYLKLAPGADSKALQAKFPEMVDKYAAPETEQANQISWEDFKKAGNGFKYFLVPLASVYLHPDDLGGMKEGGSIVTTQIMVGVAILIFILVCINFINLSVSISTERAKEVGIRKVMGSLKPNLILQFLTESVLLSLAGVALAVFIVILSCPNFNEMMSKNIVISLDGITVASLIGIALLVGVLAGIYPAFILSSYKPVTVLKGKFANNKGRLLRDGLVIFQFSISIALLISMSVVQDQARYLVSKDLGYDKEQLLVVTGDFRMNPEFANSFVNEIREMSEVESAAGSLSVPGIGVVWEESYLKEGEAGLVATKTMIVGDNFAEVLDLTVLEGKLFSENTMDTSNVLLNELAVKVFNLKEPIGATIRRSNNDGSESAFTVIGVVKDFNYDYLYNEIQPLVMQSNETIFKRVSSIVARVKPNATASAIKNIETKWKERRPGEPYTFKFVDEVVDSFYKKEQRLSRIFKILSGLSTFIACLGLFALSTQMVSLRTKEISVRKISGASTWSILVLILKYFTIMVLISFVVAVPFAYYGLERWWLTGFAYRTSIGIVPILSAGVIALILAWVSVAFQTIRAARINPVQYLGRE